MSLVPDEKADQVVTSVLLGLISHYLINITWFYIIYTINHLIVPKPSTESVIGILYFAEYGLLVIGDRKLNTNWLKHQWKFIASRNSKALV